MIAVFPADQIEKFPLPKFAGCPRDRVLPPETPAPERGTRNVLAVVSSFQPSVSAVRGASRTDAGGC